MTLIARRCLPNLDRWTTRLLRRSSSSVDSTQNLTSDGSSSSRRNKSLAWPWQREKCRVRLDRRHLTVITGCDSGLGYSMAVRASEHGSTVLAGVLEPKASGAEALSSRESVRVLPLDLSEESSRREFARSVEAVLKEERLKLHAVVNNAGLMVFGLFDWQTDEQLERQLVVNALGPMLLTRRLVGVLRRHRGRLINVSSHCAQSALPGLAVYAASKSGLESWTNALRQELKASSVPTVTFVPGSYIFETNIMSRQSQYFEEMRANMDRETRDFYGEYFEEYVKYLTPLSSTKRHDLLRDECLLGFFDGALLDEKPQAKYKCEPLRYKIYHSLFKVAPMTIRDWLIEKFMAMPKFKST